MTLQSWSLPSPHLRWYSLFVPKHQMTTIPIKRTYGYSDSLNRTLQPMLDVRHLFEYEAAIYGVSATLVLVGRPDLCKTFDSLLIHTGRDGIDKTSEYFGRSAHFKSVTRASDSELKMTSIYGRQFRLTIVKSEKEFSEACSNQPIRAASLSICCACETDFGYEAVFYGGSEVSIAMRDIEMNFNFKGVGWVNAANDILCRLLPAGFGMSHAVSSSMLGNLAAEIAWRVRPHGEYSEYRQTAHKLAANEDVPTVPPVAPDTTYSAFITNDRGPAHWPVNVTIGGPAQEAQPHGEIQHGYDEWPYDERPF